MGLHLHCHLAHRSQDQASVGVRGPPRPAVKVTSVLVGELGMSPYAVGC